MGDCREFVTIEQVQTVGNFVTLHVHKLEERNQLHQSLLEIRIQQFGRFKYTFYRYSSKT